MPFSHRWKFGRAVPLFLYDIWSLIFPKITRLRGDEKCCNIHTYMGYKKLGSVSKSLFYIRCLSLSLSHYVWKRTFASSEILMLFFRQQIAAVQQDIRLWAKQRKRRGSAGHVRICKRHNPLSDVFWFWHFRVLKDSDIFRFWRLPVLKDSDVCKVC